MTGYKLNNSSDAMHIIAPDGTVLLSIASNGMWYSDSDGATQQAAKVFLNEVALYPEALAKAWDEGYKAADDEAYHFSTWGRTDNPYRDVV